MTGREVGGGRYAASSGIAVPISTHAVDSDTVTLSHSIQTCHLHRRVHKESYLSKTTRSYLARTVWYHPGKAVSALVVVVTMDYALYTQSLYVSVILHAPRAHVIFHAGILNYDILPAAA